MQQATVEVVLDTAFETLHVRSGGRVLAHAIARSERDAVEEAARLDFAVEESTWKPIGNERFRATVHPWLNHP